MRSKLKIGNLLGAVVGAFVGLGGAGGNIVVQFVPVQPNPAATTGANILAANGWQCWLLVATADAKSVAVGGWDLATPTTPPGGKTSNHSGKDWGIFALSGGIAQRWIVSPDDGTTSQSNYGTPASIGGLVNSPDSFFFTSLGTVQQAPPSEDSNLANGPNPPYDRNPVPDNLGGGFDTGAGTFMKAAGLVLPQVQSQVIAQVWIPRGGSVVARGIVVDGTPQSNQIVFDVTFVPEPGTVGMLGAGVVMLMRRRRERGN
jgi:hypothetical protein